jgi:hypothetical protein
VDSEHIQALEKMMLELWQVPKGIMCHMYTRSHQAGDNVASYKLRVYPTTCILRNGENLQFLVMLLL